MTDNLDLLEFVAAATATTTSNSLDANSAVDSTYSGEQMVRESITAVDEYSASQATEKG